jgi:hypothetical protein
MTTPPQLAADEGVRGELAPPALAGGDEVGDGGTGSRAAVERDTIVDTTIAGTVVDGPGLGAMA